MQIYPSSITGDGFAAGGSVLEHKFGKATRTRSAWRRSTCSSTPRASTSCSTSTPCSHRWPATSSSRRSGPSSCSPCSRSPPPSAAPQATSTASCATLREYVTSVAQGQKLRVGSSGTHPFSHFERQRITARDRYRALVDQLQYVARRELIFGLHIHVAVDDPDKAVQVVNGLLVELPPLLALSANSPFWRGEATGLSSTRQMVFAAFPRSGPPPRFRDYNDYAEVVGQLEKTGCIADYTHIWWDIRPHPRLGTVEVRVCDAVSRVEHAVALAAYCQALVKHYCERYDRGEEIRSYHRILTSENKWLAARYGLEAPLMDLETGRRNRVPVAQLVRRRLRELEPHARELGSEAELEGIQDILDKGNGAHRQLRVFNANRDIVEVVREIADATEEAAVGSAT